MQPSLTAPTARLAHAAAVVLASATWLAGCASTSDMDAAYEHSLARWKGAPSLLLAASWGPPNLQETLPDGRVRFVYVVRHELARPQPAGGTVVVGNDGRSVTVVEARPPLPGLQAALCTTRFVLEKDLVVAWDFSGQGCGAP